MFERFGHTARQLIVEYLQEVFRVQTSWGNVDQPSISLKGLASPDVFEEFAKEPEKYPCVIIGNRGAVQAAAAIDGFIGQGAYTETWGQYPTFVTVIGDGARAAIKATPAVTATWHTAAADLKWRSGGDNVVVTIASGSNVETAVAVTSGSINSFTGSSIITKVAAFTAATPVNRGGNVWLTFSTDGEGTYYLCGDDSRVSGSASSTQYVRASGSSGSAYQIVSGSTYCCTVSDRTSERRGGTKTTSIDATVLAKDQVAADQIADLCCVYLELARQARLTRLTDLSITNSLLVDSVGALLKKGVAVAEVRKGSTSTTKRGQDNLYRIPVTITLFSTWYEDFGREYLDDVIPVTETY